jgi:signal transduction histidine kinase
MTVSQYLDTDFTTVSIKENVQQLKTKFLENDCLVVLDESDEAVGLLICSDLVAGARTAGDCLYNRSFISPQENLLHVVNLMKHTGHERLLVKENSTLLGVVKFSTVVFPLAEMVKKYQLLFQHVTHDLRNPIGNITGIFSLLSDSLVKTENIELLTYGQEAGKQALDMLNELLDIEKKDNDSTGFRITEASQFIAKCVEQLKGITIQKEISLETKLTTAEFFAKLNQRHFQRVLHNIISNAVKFSHPGGRINIASEIKDGKFLLSIRDEGVGIPLELQAFIFDHFTPAQRKGTAGEKSTGLGLYFAKETMELHGGRIWFESAAVSGTTFYLEIPSY